MHGTAIGQSIQNPRRHNNDKRLSERAESATAAHCMLSSSHQSLQSSSLSSAQSSSLHQSYIVENDSLRLVGFLKWKLGISSGHVGRLLQHGWISVNTVVRTHKSALLSAGDIVTTHATPFQMAQVRFALPLLTVRYRDSVHAILWKPAGMPLEGMVSETVATALPASMPNSSYQVVDSVGRIASGPILVRFLDCPTEEEDDDKRHTAEDDHHHHHATTTTTTMQQPQQQAAVLRQRFTFVVIVHGTPPSSCKLDVKGFESLVLLQTISSTMTATTTDAVPSSVLSMIQVVMNHSGIGLRGCLLRHGCPILGTSARSKSKANGCFLACTKVELLFSNQMDRAVIVEADLPAKFRTIIQREERFYRVRQVRLDQQQEQHEELRLEFLQGKGSHLDLTTENWNVVPFCEKSFYVTDHVMTPRTSSELLVQAAKRALSDRPVTQNMQDDTSFSILDLGTGSGCLLISTLLGESPNVVGVGVDISAKALGVAKINATMHGITDQIVWQQGDFQNLSFLGDSKFDIVLCNPPYLTQAECDKDGLLGPRLALVAPDTLGLGCYQMVADQVKAFLKQQSSSNKNNKSSSILILEVGGKRKVSDVLAIFHQENWECIASHPDGQGQTRCLVLRPCDVTNILED